MLDGPAGVEVITAGAEEDRAGRVGKDHPLGVVRAVLDLVAAEAAIEDGGRRKIGGERLPSYDGRGADEEHGTLRRGIDFVRGFKGRHSLFPF